MIYRFQSQVGVFTIRPQRDGHFGLFMGEECLGSYHSPDEAAKDVSLQVTGWDEWDSLREALKPSVLQEWEALQSRR